MWQRQQTVLKEREGEQSERGEEGQVALVSQRKRGELVESTPTHLLPCRDLLQWEQRNNLEWRKLYLRESESVCVYMCLYLSAFCQLQWVDGFILSNHRVGCKRYMVFVGVQYVCMLQYVYLKCYCRLLSNGNTPRGTALSLHSIIQYIITWFCGVLDSNWSVPAFTS